MSRLDWKRFCDDNGIHYVTEGPQTPKGHISIQCPFCGDDDPSQHMQLKLGSTLWGCWRSPSHRGAKPHRLIQRLLGCSYEIAESFLSKPDEVRELSQFEEKARALRAYIKGSDDTTEGEELIWPKRVKPLRRTGRGRLYWDYLVTRGFRERDVDQLIEDYSLRYADRGYWRGRIVIPLYYEGRLVSWTGRSVYKTVDLRYMSLKKKHSIIPVKDLVWNYDELVSQKWKAILVVEGPLDALKVDFYAKKHGVRATCLFGTGVTQLQALLLEDVASSCDWFGLCPDVGAERNGLDLRSRMLHLRPDIVYLPPGVEDPGELNKKQVEQLIRCLR